MLTIPPASNPPALDILVVDDSDVDAQLTLHALTHLNPQPRPLWLSDGRQTMDYLMCCGHKGRSCGPSLVLTDMHMPWLSGLELLAQIRAEARLCRLPVILLSGHADPHELAECYRLGVNGYLEKRISYNTFTRQLTRAVTECFNPALTAPDHSGLVAS